MFPEYWGSDRHTIPTIFFKHQQFFPPFIKIIVGKIHCRKKRKISESIQKEIKTTHNPTIQKQLLYVFRDMDIAHDQGHGGRGREWAGAQKREGVGSPGSQEGFPGGGGRCFQVGGSTGKGRKAWHVGWDSGYVRAPREKR